MEAEVVDSGLWGEVKKKDQIDSLGGKDIGG